MNEEILKQFEQRMLEGFASVKELITKSEDINKERMAELRHKVEEQEKRINKLEASVSYNVGKIVGISAVISTLLTIVVWFFSKGA